MPSITLNEAMFPGWWRNQKSQFQSLQQYLAGNPISEGVFGALWHYEHFEDAWGPEICQWSAYFGPAVRLGAPRPGDQVFLEYWSAAATHRGCL